jgi:hypothetical protein
MLLEKFSDIIDRSPIGASVAKRRKLIEQTNPNRIYAENIRSFFGIPKSVAIYLCDIAVREGLFEKRIGYLCPNDDCHSMLWDVAAGQKVPKDVVAGQEVPKILGCDNCEALGREDYEFGRNECRQIEFYRVVPRD